MLDLLHNESGRVQNQFHVLWFQFQSGRKLLDLLRTEGGLVLRKGEGFECETTRGHVRVTFR
jgi:hypothetical protein